MAMRKVYYTKPLGKQNLGMKFTKRDFSVAGIEHDSARPVPKSLSDITRRRILFAITLTRCWISVNQIFP